MAEESTRGFDISNVIDQKLIALDLDVSNKVEMLERLTDLFEEQGKLNDREAFFKDVMWREGEGQTGIDMGVAIPHGKSEGVNETALAIGTSKQPSPWGMRSMSRPRARLARRTRSRPSRSRRPMLSSWRSTSRSTSRVSRGSASWRFPPPLSSRLPSRSSTRSRRA